MASPKKKPRVVIDLEEKHRGNEPDSPWWCAMKRGSKTTQWADRFSEYLSLEEHESTTKKLQEELEAYKETLTRISKLEKTVHYDWASRQAESILTAYKEE